MEDSPNASGCPALRYFGSLFSEVHLPFAQVRYLISVDAYTAVELTTEEFWKTPFLRTRMQNTILEILGLIITSMAAKAICDYTCIHRPNGSIVVRPWAKKRI